MFLHTVPNIRKHIKVTVKIIQKTDNEIFGINTILGPFVVIVIEVFLIFYSLEAT